jgi:hypothetical protein
MKALPKLSLQHILGWADAHYERMGQWPKRDSGQVADAPDEKWRNIDQALVKGLRGLPEGLSLARLLAEHRRVRNVQKLPRLSVEQILAWADAHHERGQWPNRNSGEVADAPDEKWFNIDQALVKGLRGLPGGSSLAKLRPQTSGRLIKRCQTDKALQR